MPSEETERARVGGDAHGDLPRTLVRRGDHDVAVEGVDVRLAIRGPGDVHVSCLMRWDGSARLPGLEAHHDAARKSHVVGVRAWRDAGHEQRIAPYVAHIEHCFVISGDLAKLDSAAPRFARRRARSSKRARTEETEPAGDQLSHGSAKRPTVASTTGTRKSLVARSEGMGRRRAVTEEAVSSSAKSDPSHAAHGS